jgi:hypothetical protein
VESSSSSRGSQVVVVNAEMLAELLAFRLHSIMSRTTVFFLVESSNCGRLESLLLGTTKKSSSDNCHSDLNIVSGQLPKNSYPMAWSIILPFLHREK